MRGDLPCFAGLQQAATTDLRLLLTPRGAPRIHSGEPLNNSAGYSLYLMGV